MGVTLGGETTAETTVTEGAAVAVATVLVTCVVFAITTVVCLFCAGGVTATLVVDAAVASVFSS